MCVQDRIIFLRGEDLRDGRRIPACCDCSDWKIIASRKFGTEIETAALEEQFLDEFPALDVYGRDGPSWYVPWKSTGDGEVVLLPTKLHDRNMLASLSTNVRDLFVSGRARMFDGLHPDREG